MQAIVRFTEVTSAVDRILEQVRAQLPTYADNVALLPFAAEHWPYTTMAIDISCRLGPQQQTHRTMLQREDETDRQTNGRTPYRYANPAPHQRTVPIKSERRKASADVVLCFPPQTTADTDTVRVHL